MIASRRAAAATAISWPAPWREFAVLAAWPRERSVELGAHLRPPAAGSPHRRAMVGSRAGRRRGVPERAPASLLHPSGMKGRGCRPRQGRMHARPPPKRPRRSNARASSRSLLASRRASPVSPDAACTSAASLAPRRGTLHRGAPRPSASLAIPESHEGHPEDDSARRSWPRAIRTRARGCRNSPTRPSLRSRSATSRLARRSGTKSSTACSRSLSRGARRLSSMPSDPPRNMCVPLPLSAVCHRCHLCRLAPHSPSPPPSPAADSTAQRVTCQRRATQIFGC